MRFITKIVNNKQQHSRSQGHRNHGAAGAAAPPPLHLLCGGIWGQKVPFGRAQKCPLKNDKIKL